MLLSSPTARLSRVYEVARALVLRAAALAILLLAAAPGLADGQAPELAGLDAYIEQAMRDWEVPGLAIAVVRNDSVLLARGYGERLSGSGDGVDEHTLFAIASTSKAMTVAGLGMLVDEGAIRWDDRVTAHLPGFELADPYVTREVVIRDLLTHRTGVARHDNIWIAAPFDRAEIVRRARHLPQATGFRAGYGYNNIMYMVAGEVTAAAAGTTWENFIESRLFAPLGMTRTTPRSAVVEGRDNVAIAHVREDGRLIPMARRDYDALGPAGSVWSSAWDMAQWLRLHLGGGVYEGRRLLERSTIAAMYEPQVVLGLDTTTLRMFPDRTSFSYGLGWRLHDYRGRRTVQHTGAVNYTRTQVGMLPDENIGVVVMTNLSTSTLQTALMYYVFDALLGVPPTDWSAEYLVLARRSAAAAERRAAQADAARIAGTRPSLSLDGYVGTYTDSLFGDIRVDLEDGRLVLDYSPDYVADLEHWHHDTFRARWRSAGFGTALVTFALDARGQPRSLELEGFTTFRRRPPDGAAAAGRARSVVEALEAYVVDARRFDPELRDPAIGVPMEPEQAGTTEQVR
jgi:CubicO group peptidase (beta-lactamase class C family)